MTKGPRKPSAREEIEFLTDECLLALSLMEKCQPGLAFVLLQQRHMVEHLFATGDRTLLRRMKREILRAVDTMPRRDREGILKQLPESWQSVADEELRKVRAVEARGMIKSAGEFRLVLERVEKIHQQADKRDEVKRLNELLARYELGKSARG